MFELLALIPKGSWRESILGIKEGKFLPDHGIGDIEELFITDLLTTQPETRPYDVQDIIESSFCLSDIAEG